MRNLTWLVVLAVLLGGIAMTVGQAGPAAAAPTTATTYLDSIRGVSSVTGLVTDTFAASDYLRPDPSDDPSISGDGRFVTFVGPGAEQDAAARNNLAPPPSRRSIWLRDRATGETRELTPAPGAPFLGDSQHPTISRNGCFVAFLTTGAYDQVRDFPSGPPGVDVYRALNPMLSSCTLPTGASTYTLVSASARTGLAVNTVSATQTTRVDTSQRPSMSSDGQYVAYVGRGEIQGSFAGSPAINAGYLERAVYVVDTTEPVTSPTRNLTPPDRQGRPPLTSDGVTRLSVFGSFHPMLSDDGSTLVYATDTNPWAPASDPDGGWAVDPTTPSTNPSMLTPQVVTWAVGSAAGPDVAFTLVSHRTGTAAPWTLEDYGRGASLNPAIDSVGDRVAYTSGSTDLVAATVGSTAATYRVFVATPGGPNVLVSQAAAPVNSGFPSFSPFIGLFDESFLLHTNLSISGDGRFVAYGTSTFAASPGGATLGRGRSLAVSRPTPAARPVPAAAAPGFVPIHAFVTRLDDTTLAPVATDQLDVTPDGSSAPTGSAAMEPWLSTTGRYASFSATNSTALLGVPATDLRQVLTRDRLAVARIVPSVVDFASVVIGSSVVSGATVVNDGGGSWVYDQSFVSGSPIFSVVGGTCVNGLSLGPGESCTILVRFSPALGAQDGSLRASPDPATDFTASLACVGTPQPEACSIYNHDVSPTARLVGVGLPPSTAPTTTTSTTAATPPTTTTSTSRPPTSVKPPATTKPPATIPPTVKPTNPPTTKPPPRYALRLEPPTGNFGVVKVNQSSTPLVFQLRNVGNVPNAVASVATAGINAVEFTVTVNGCRGVVLAVNQACPITVVNKPLDSGGRAAVLVAFGQGGANASSVLVASGLYQPLIAFNPAVVSAGRTTMLVGSGFPANTQITLSWLGRNQTPFLATTDSAGGLRLAVFILPHEQAGTRLLVVTDQPGRLTSVPPAPVLIVLSTFQPQVVTPALFKDKKWVTRG